MNGISAAYLGLEHKQACVQGLERKKVLVGSLLFVVVLARWCGMQRSHNLCLLVPMLGHSLSRLV